MSRGSEVVRSCLVWDNHGCMPLRPDDRQSASSVIDGAWCATVVPLGLAPPVTTTAGVAGSGMSGNPARVFRQPRMYRRRFCHKPRNCVIRRQSRAPRIQLRNALVYAS